MSIAVKTKPSAHKMTWAQTGNLWSAVSHARTSAYVGGGIHVDIGPRMVWTQVASTDDESIFLDLKKRWERDRPRGVDVEDASAHHAYRAIVALGWRAVGPILREMNQRRGHWFIALQEITGRNPVASEHEGNLRRMTEDWLQWGRRLGYTT